MFFSSSTTVTGSALAVFRAHSAIVRSASCSAMTTPNSGCNVTLSWWMKLDLFAGLEKNLSLYVSHLCCGCTSRCLLIFPVWRYVVDLPFSREEDICHGFAVHAMKDGLPNSLCIISINKWRHCLCISNSVRIFGQKAHSVGIVLLYVVDVFQQTIFVPSKPWQTCIMVLIWWFHIHPWWRHQMETISTLLTICAGNSPHKGQ